MDAQTNSIPDLSSCELEPIRFPGAVQPHGALLVLHPETHLIEAASESCLALLGVAADRLLGQSLSQAFGAGVDQAVGAVADQGLGALASLQLGARQFSARCCRNQAGQLLVDIEPDGADGALANQLMYEIRRELPRLRGMGSVVEITSQAALLLRRLTGLDRVMVYRFDAAWNGEVIAEACDPAIEPYLGLHYPASDIPAQARALFQQSRVRLIADVSYLPSALLARGDAHGVDLGASSLRSVSPVHIEYLRNMRVSATLVGSLVVDGKLWGLVSCQQTSGPKYLGPRQRDVIGWLCEDIAALIKATLERQRAERADELSRRRRRLVDVVRAVHIKALIRHGSVADLLAVVNADGFALLADRSIQIAGQAPERSRIREIHRQKLARATDPQFYATSSLCADLGLTDVGDGLAGAVFVSLADRPDVTLVWFRMERRRSIRWGGNPGQAHVDVGSGRLSPRKSFEQFLQTIRGQCLPWSDEEISSARELATLIEIETLREREAFTQTILNSIPSNIVVLDEQGIIVSANAAWKRFADDNGAPQLVTESVGLSYLSICSAAFDQPDGVEAAAAWAGIEAVQNGALDYYTLDYPCDSPDERRWFRMNVYPLHEPCEGTVVMHENITRAKLGELILDEERAQLRILLETIPDLVWLKSPQGVYMTCNAQFERFFGAPRADIVGHTDYDFVDKAKADDFMRHDRAAIEANRPLVIEEWATYACDGHEARLETTKTAMVDAKGVLIGVLGVARDITERHRLQLQTEHMSLYDTLTGLANRHLLNDRLGLALTNCKRTGRRAALLFLDLDNFKPLNDVFGHDVGDQLLVEVARRLKSCVRGIDTVARFGGDEFLVLLGELDVDPDTARLQAQALSDKVHAALGAPYTLASRREGRPASSIDHHCSASIGVVVFDGLAASNAEVLRLADAAMYEAKNAGGGGVRLHLASDPRT